MRNTKSKREFTKNMLNDFNIFYEDCGFGSEYNELYFNGAYLYVA